MVSACAVLSRPCHRVMARVLPLWTALLLPANAVLSSSLLWSPDLLAAELPSCQCVLCCPLTVQVPREAVLSMRSVLASAGASSSLASLLPVLPLLCGLCGCAGRNEVGSCRLPYLNSSLVGGCLSRISRKYGFVGEGVTGSTFEVSKVHARSGD